MRRHRYHKNPIEEDLILLGALGAGGYLLWQWLSKGPVGQAASTAYNATVNSTSNAMTSIAQAVGLAPTYNLSSTYVPVEFPDGSVHTVAVSIIGADGSFTVPSDSSGTYVTAAVASQFGGESFTLQGYPTAPGGTNSSFIAQ